MTARTCHHCRAPLPSGGTHTCNPAALKATVENLRAVLGTMADVFREHERRYRSNGKTVKAAAALGCAVRCEREVL